MAKTRRAAQVTERLARFGYYDPNEALTGIGNATPKQVLQGYDTPNIQAAIDELYYQNTVDVGGLLISRYAHNPRPSAWGTGSPLAGRPQIEDIVISGVPTNKFWYTIDGVDVELTHGDTASTVATKIANALNAAKIEYTASIGSPTNAIIITYVDYGDQTAIATPAVQYGITATISTPTPGSSSPQVNEVQGISISGTVSISGDISIKDSATSPNITAAATVSDTSTAATVKTALEAALNNESPIRYASVTSINSTTIRVTYADNNAHDVNYDSFNGITLRGTLVQRNISDADIVDTRTNQQDTITVICNTGGITEVPFTLSITDIGIQVAVPAATTQDDIAQLIADAINALPNLVATYVSGNSLTIEYQNTYYRHLTDYKEWFDTLGSVGIGDITISPETPNPTSPLTPIEVRYSSIQALDLNGEVTYGKWAYYGEGILNAPTEQDFYPADVETSINTFGEPVLLASPQSVVYTFSKNLFTMGRIMLTARTLNMGSPKVSKYFGEIITLLNSGSDVNWTEDTMLSNDTLESDVFPVTVSFAIVGNNIQMTVTRATSDNVELSIKLLDHDKIISKAEQVKVYYWERIE